MARKAFDFNAIERPALTLTLRDEARTTINVTFPETELVETLYKVTPKLQEMGKNRDPKAVREVYELTAALMSNNEEGLTVTADQLRGIYRIGFLDIVQFLTAYLGFIGEVKEEKN